MEAPHTACFYEKAFIVRFDSARFAALLSGCAAHKVDVPALEFGGTEGDGRAAALF